MISSKSQKSSCALLRFHVNKGPWIDINFFFFTGLFLIVIVVISIPWPPDHNSLSWPHTCISSLLRSLTWTYKEYGYQRIFQTLILAHTHEWYRVEILCVALIWPLVESFSSLMIIVSIEPFIINGNIIFLQCKFYIEQIFGNSICQIVNWMPSNLKHRFSSVPEPLQIHVFPSSSFVPVSKNSIS